MNKSLFFALLGLSAFFFACKNDSPTTTEAPVEHADKNNLEGYWIAIDFCTRAGEYGSVLTAMNTSHRPYFYAFSFSQSEDSVVCFNGSGAIKLAYQINVDTIELKNAFDGKSLFLGYSPVSKDLTLYDVSVSPAQTDRFIKSGVKVSNGYQAFTSLLNRNLFEGNWKLVAGGKSDQPVGLTPDGNIFNLGDYDRYGVCTNGDCFRLGSQMDIISLGASKRDNAITRFGFKFSTQKDTLSFYHLKETDPKMVAELGGLAYRLVRLAPKNVATKTTTPE
jgi:hypothetical protein